MWSEASPSPVAGIPFAVLPAVAQGFGQAFTERLFCLDAVRATVPMCYVISSAWNRASAAGLDVRRVFLDVLDLICLLPFSFCSREARSSLVLDSVRTSSRIKSAARWPLMDDPWCLLPCQAVMKCSSIRSHSLNICWVRVTWRDH